MALLLVKQKLEAAPDQTGYIKLFSCRVCSMSILSAETVNLPSKIGCFFLSRKNIYRSQYT